MGSRTLSWIDVDGTEWPLNGETYYQSLHGPTGLYGIPINIVTQDVPAQPGTTVKFVQLLPGQITIPMIILADTEEILDDARRALKWATAASRGAGKLRHVSNDGEEREINCLLSKGFEGDESGGLHAPGALWLTLTFLAADPFWYDVDYTQQLFTVSAGSGFFDNPAILPIKLAPTGIAGSISILNDGDAIAWPRWVLNGPMTSAVFTNNTTGDTLTVTATLTAGQSIVIDTDPDQKIVSREDDSKHFEYISPTSSLWGIFVGSNAINVQVNGNGSGTQLALQYKQRYEGV